ncbi:hypothetical protein L195_g014077, partial [Trifolium pratense]
SDSFSHKEVPLDTNTTQQLMKEWVSPIDKPNQQDILEPRQRKKPVWTRDFIMAILK